MPDALFAFHNTYADELEGLYTGFVPDGFSAPEVVLFNAPLAAELGVDAVRLRAEAAEVLSGNRMPAGAAPLAQAYAGHQFGGFSPRLGDGRALLLGEVVDVHGQRRDIHLKGSGRTPFSRGGDGFATLGPMLREYVMGEAMHALGIPTTRALSVVATGDKVRRETWLPGAVLARVASSHLRVGTFEYFAHRRDLDNLTRLGAYTVARHVPDGLAAPQPALALLAHVIEAQASLVAQWMHVGFIHGVLNTDNVTISGETIDFGPCAFMDAYDPDTVFSSIDHHGRYAYGNQPAITAWNLTRLAEALLPLIDSDTPRAVEAAQGVLSTYAGRYAHHWLAGMRRKLGLATEDDGDKVLVDSLLDLMHAHSIDFTQLFRALAGVVRGDEAALRALWPTTSAALRTWLGAWQERLADEARPAVDVAAGMDAVNPVYIPRNHLVEAALDAAVAGDLGPFHALLDAVTQPFAARPGLEAYAQPAPADFGPYQTFCGT